ncbi:MAG: low specificity L-threonine aldolase, partial [Hyphomicrobiales bacterium]|nr:low specificity L-threonine aldolase [Hyphomicrobiales bacterium]
MQFGSDNTAGASAKIIAAIAAANDGRMVSYGADEITARVERRMAEFFGREVAVFLVTTGTAANALAIQALSPVFGAVLAHEESHLLVDECGAPEF